MKKLAQALCQLKLKNSNNSSEFVYMKIWSLPSTLISFIKNKFGGKRKNMSQIEFSFFLPKISLCMSLQHFFFFFILKKIVKTSLFQRCPCLMGLYIVGVTSDKHKLMECFPNKIMPVLTPD